MHKHLALFFGVVCLTVGGCGADEVLDTTVAPVDSPKVGKGDGGYEVGGHRWAVDMRKVQEHYGQSSQTFFGVGRRSPGCRRSCRARTRSCGIRRIRWTGTARWWPRPAEMCW